MSALRFSSCAAAGAALAISACSIPARDNPFDPANAPRARLVIADPVESVTSHDLVAPWAHDILLDATASTDNQGDIEHCIFVISDSATGVVIGETDESECLTPLRLVGLVPLAERTPSGELLLGKKYEVSVIVVDEEGYAGRSPDPRDPDPVRNFFTLTNLEPVADAGFPRALPIGGLPWASAGTPTTVRFSGADSYDPDGDPLEYCWTKVSSGVPDEEVCSTDEAFEFDVPAGSVQTFLGRLRVRDELSISRTRNARVSFREPNLWILPLGPGPVERLDIAHRTLVWADQNQFVSATETSGGRIAIVADVIGDGFIDSSRHNELYVIDPPLREKSELTPVPGVTLASTGFTKLASDPSDPRRFWLRSQNAPSASFVSVENPFSLTCGAPDDCDYLSSYLVEGGTVSPERLVTISDVLTSQDREGGTLVVDTNGYVYLGHQFAPALQLIAPANGTSVEDVLGDPAGFVSAVAPRPDSDETWVLVSHLFDGGADSELYILEAGEIVAQATVPGFSVIFGVGWISSGEFWMGLAGIGMGRFNAETLRTQATTTGLVDVDAALLQVVEDFFDVGGIVVDRVSGDCWLSGIATGDLTRLSPDGEAVTFELAGDESTTPMFVDEKGALWHSPRQTLEVGFAPGESGIVTTVPFHPSAGIEYDYDTGGVMLTNTVPPALVVVAEDGSLLRYEESLAVASPAGTTRVFPFGSLFRLAHGRSTAYVAELNLFAGVTGISRIDLTEDPPLGTSILDGTTSSQILSNGSVFEPFTAAGAARIWTVLDDGAGVPAVALIDEAGAVVDPDVFTFPAGERIQTGAGDFAPQQIRAVRSLASNDLCFATVEGDTSDGNADMLRVRIARANDGSVVDVGSFSAVMHDSTLNGLAALPLADGRLACWVGFWVMPAMSTDRAHIRAWAEDGTLVASYDTPGSLPFGERITSLVPYSVDEVWASMERNDGSSVNHTVRVGILRNATSGDLEEAVTLRPTFRSVLTAPWARAVQDGLPD